MPSIHIHLAIAEEYIKKHKIKDKDKLLEGSIAPDFAKPKEISHYVSAQKENISLRQELDNSANFKKYLKENKIENDFDRGYALHILADELFFKHFFSEECLEKYTSEQFKQNLYKSYSALNLYLVEKYNIKISEDMEKRIDNLIKAAMEQKVIDNNLKFENIISIDKLEKFIEEISDIDIDIYSKNELNKS